MLPVPIDPEEREQWKATPIFRRRGKSVRPWDTSSYRKAWAAAVQTAAADHPEVEGVWLRDLRKAAKTRMVDAGVSELVVNRILGHRDGVTARYYKLSDAAMRQALEALTLESCTPNRTPADSAATAS